MRELVGQRLMMNIYKPVPPQTSSALKYIFTKKRSDKNSTASAVAGIASVINDAISPPAGVELRNENEHLIWSQFTRARAKSDWRGIDLSALAKLLGWRQTFA